MKSNGIINLLSFFPSGTAFEEYQYGEYPCCCEMNASSCLPCVIQFETFLRNSICKLFLYMQTIYKLHIYVLYILYIIV